MSARDNILARIRAAQEEPGSAMAAEREAVPEYIRAHPRGPLPRVDADRVAHFNAQALSLASSVSEVPTRGAVPPCVAAYLREKSLPLSAVCWPELAGLEWHAAGINVEARAAEGIDPTGITGAFCAIAETGTLMLLSGPATAGATSLLPETHIAIVDKARVVASMEDAWDLLRAERGALPRAVNFISGPSRTADIEQTVVLGAHGPYRLHIILIG